MPTPTIKDLLRASDPLRDVARIREEFRPKPRKGYVWLGVVLEQKNPFPSWTKVIFENGWIGIPIKALFLQTFILGATGSGKTEFQKNLVYQLIEDGSCDVVVIDGKADHQFVEESCVMASLHGHKTPVLRLGWNQDSALFSGFDGDAEAVWNRLVTMFALDPLFTDADYYKNRKREILQLICGFGDELKHGLDPIEPPRSFQELERRASETWISETYKDSVAFSESVKYFVKGGMNYLHVQDLKSDVASATTPFLKVMHPAGFRLGEYPLTFFSIDDAVASFSAPYFFRFLAGYINFYLSQKHKRTVVFCDEFALFGAGNVVKLLNTGRSKGGAFILATQSIGTLGGERHIADQIVDGPNLKLLFRCDLPEDVVRKFGTGKVADTAHQTRDGEVSGITIRYIDKFNVDINKLKNFHPGECMFEFGGLARIQTQMIPELPPYNPDMEVKYQLERNNRPQHDSSVTAPIPE